MDQASEWRQTCDWKQEYKTEIPSKCWQKTISILNELLGKSKDIFWYVCVCLRVCVCKVASVVSDSLQAYGL